MELKEGKLPTNFQYLTLENEVIAFPLLLVCCDGNTKYAFEKYCRRR